jgi:hypothetical protein
MSGMLTAGMFQPHVGKLFREKGGRHALTLNQVELHKTEQSELDAFGRQSFTLLFSGPPGDVLPQGFYDFEVDGGPAFHLHVIPIRTLIRDRQDYQAVFN